MRAQAKVHNVPVSLLLVLGAEDVLLQPVQVQTSAAVTESDQACGRRVINDHITEANVSLEGTVEVLQGVAYVKESPHSADVHVSTLGKYGKDKPAADAIPPNAKDDEIPAEDGWCKDSVELLRSFFFAAVASSFSSSATTSKASVQIRLLTRLAARCTS